ncbi:MAG: penicillin-binding protein 2 [Bacteroidales bacterium]|nr:penicillin-binding protein 2 [Bacteroidales bacterium]
MKKKLSFKLLFVYFLLLVWTVVIIARMFSLTLRMGDAYRGNFKDTLTVGNRFFQIDSGFQHGFRGNVYSSEGELLSTTIPIYDLYWEMAKVGVKPKDSVFFMERVDSLISIFCRLTPKRSRDFYEEKVKRAYLDYYHQCRVQQDIIDANKDHKGKKVRAAAKARLDSLKFAQRNRYLIVRISVDELPQTWVRSSDWDRIRYLFSETESEMTRQYYGGCRVDERFVHHNVYDDYAASVIGFMHADRNYSGVEGYYDSLLSGENRKYRRLLVNRVVVPLRETQLLQVKNGCDITTTIDVGMQSVVEKALRAQLERLDVEWGCALLMEVKTGEIKAISNLTKTPQGYRDYVEHAITERYEPGSTFKLISLLAALDSKKIDTGDMVDCEKGRHTLRWAFEFSDNDGLYEAARTGYRTLNQFFLKMHQMGLDSNLELEVVNAATPDITKTKRYESDYHSISHGYAVVAPPVYMAAYYNAVANNGRFMRPYLVKEVLYPDGRNEKRRPTVIKERIADPVTLSKARACMEGVVATGTARRAQDAYYKRHKDDSTQNVALLLAGKTGTAQMFENGRYVQNKYNASFIGYFPSDKPVYTCMVLISGVSRDAGVVAAPVCRDIAEKIVNRDLSMRQFVYRDALWNKYPSVAFGYAPDLALVYRKLGYRIQYPTKTPWVGVMPATGRDSLLVMRGKHEASLERLLLGASAKDAVYLLERQGYKVRLKGAGKVSGISCQGKWAIVTLKN